LQRVFDRRRHSLLATLVFDASNDPGFERLLGRDRSAPAALRAALQGRDLTIAYVRGSPSHERTATLLQQLLQQAGVASTLRPAPGFAYQGADGPLRTGRFDVAISGLVYGDQPDLPADWSCSERPPKGGNFARWCDAAFEAAAGRGDVAAMLRRLYDSVACIPLTRAYEDLGVARRVGGFSAPEPLTPATYGCTAWRVSAGVASSSVRTPRERSASLPWAAEA
jgi:ABC-type transport system substrate-binding protein